MIYIFIFIGLLVFAIYCGVTRRYGSIDHKDKVDFSIIKEKFISAPFGIKIYIVMSYLFLLFPLCMFLPGYIKQIVFSILVPFHVTFPLGMILPFLWLNVSKNKSGLNWFRRLIVLFSLIHLARYIPLPGADYSNQYLIVRLVIVCSFPLLWAFYFSRKKTAEYFAELADM